MLPLQNDNKWVVIDRQGSINIFEYSSKQMKFSSNSPGKILIGCVLKDLRTIVYGTRNSEIYFHSLDPDAGKMSLRKYHVNGSYGVSVIAYNAVKKMIAFGSLDGKVSVVKIEPKKLRI
jgi:hypothetical protein